jgi:hypothetical protein
MLERTHPGADNPVPQGNWARAGVSIYPESKDPPDPGIDLRISQLDQEGAVRAAGPWIPPHCHLTQWPMKVRRRSEPVNPSRSKL